MTGERTSWTAKTMLARWTAMPNDLIGGWCVMAVDKPPSAAREPEVCDMMNQEIAEHVAELHNRWLRVGRDRRSAVAQARDQRSGS